MKKLFLSIVTITVLPTIFAARLKTSQSFLLTRPAYDNVQALQFLWRDALAEDKSIFRVTPIYQKSFRDKRLARLFLLKCQSDILVAGDASANNTLRDVRAEWLGLPATFSGRYTLCPQQTQYSATMSYFHHLKSLGWSFIANSWIGITMPIVGMTNAAHPAQFDSQNSAGPTSGDEIVNAMNSSAMIYGKIAPCKLSKTTVPELRFVFGTTWTTKNDFLLMYYTGISFPTYKRQQPHYLFGPVLGHNRHYQLIAGLSAELPLHEEGSDFHCKLFMLAENNFLMRNHQLRSFDVFNKPWTRYLQLRKAVTLPDGTITGSAETTPAVNAFTFPVRVHPNSYFNMALGLSFDQCGFTGEVAYQLWAHARERLQLMKSCCEGTPLPFEMYGIAGTGTSSASESLINTQAPNDLIFTTFKRGDIDLQSGANRGAFSQAINASVGYRGDRGFIGVGGFWEKPNTDTALEQWGVWGTIAYSF